MMPRLIALNHSIFLTLWLVFGFLIPAHGQELIFEDQFEVSEVLALRIVVTPGALLLTENGETAVLNAEVLNENDQPVSVPVRWRSSDSTALQVDQQGAVTALQSTGSARIIAEADNAASVAVLVVIADPVDGAQLISDVQVIDGPEPVDPNADYGGLGYQYTVTLSGVAVPVPGDILIGTGEIPLGGRVVAVQVNGNTVIVTLELIGLDELFDALTIQETFDLSQAPVLIPTDISDNYTVRRYRDGRFEFIPKPTAFSAQASAKTDNTLNLGPFECKLTMPLQVDLTDVLSIFVDGTTISITPNLITHEVDYPSNDEGLKKSTITGSVHAYFAMKPQIKSAVELGVECKQQFFSPYYPAPAALGFFFGANVPIGVGFSTGAKVSAGPVGFDVVLNGEVAFTAGCFSSDSIFCDGIAEGSMGNQPDSWEWILPSGLSETFKLEAGSFGFLFTDLAIGPPNVKEFDVFKKLQIVIAGAKGGYKGGVDIATPLYQAQQSTYASTLKLDVAAEIGVGLDAAIKGIFESLFKLTLISKKWEPSITLESSPQGTLVIGDPNGGISTDPNNPSRVIAGGNGIPGEAALFEANLDPVNFLGSYSVDAVELYWEQPDGQGGFVLEPAPSPCNSIIPISEGQNQFTCALSFLPEDVGTHIFYAFVKVGGYTFEIAKDSSTVLIVDPSPFDISCDPTQSIIAESEADLVPLQGLTEFPGNITLQGNTLTDVDALNDLVTVGCGLTIQSTSINDLSGLSALRYIGGNLVIIETTLSSLAGLENLTTVEGSVRISRNPAMTSMAEFTRLNSVASLNLSFMPALTSITFPALTEIVNNPQLNLVGQLGLGVEVLGPGPHIHFASGVQINFPVLRFIDFSAAFNSLDNPTINLPALESVTISVTLDGNRGDIVLHLTNPSFFVRDIKFLKNTGTLQFSANSTCVFDFDRNSFSGGSFVIEEIATNMCPNTIGRITQHTQLDINISLNQPINWFYFNSNNNLSFSSVDIPDITGLIEIKNNTGFSDAQAQAFADSFSVPSQNVDISNNTP